MERPRSGQSNSDYGRGKPSRTERPRAGQSDSDYVEGKPFRTERSRTGRSDSDYGPGKPFRTERPRSGQSNSDYGRERPFRTERSESGQRSSDYGRGKPFRTERSSTGQSNSDYGRGKPFHTERPRSGQSSLDYGRENPFRTERPRAGQSDSDYGQEKPFRPERPRAGQSDSDYGRGNPFHKERGFDVDRQPRNEAEDLNLLSEPSSNYAERQNTRNSSTVSYSPRADNASSADQASFRSALPHGIPLSIPYTTSASEFLYGTSAVMAALRSRRRKLYKLYIYESESRRNPGRDDAVEKLARNAGVEVQHARGDWARVMDKMSVGRPHNGYILEASPVPKLPVTSLERINTPRESFYITVGQQSEEELEINGTNSAVALSDNDGSRFPFVLMVDGIVDVGNIGNLLRTAYYFGVDAVAISSRNSASISPVAVKASGGASEYIPIFSIGDPDKFTNQTLINGWKIYAAVAPPSLSSSSSSSTSSSFVSSRMPNSNYISINDLQSPLSKHPCILMLGGEGEGLRWNLRKKANHRVGIEGVPGRKEIVDSLNVTVAAGILCEAFLRPEKVEEEGGSEEEGLVRTTTEV